MELKPIVISRDCIKLISFARRLLETVNFNRDKLTVARQISQRGPLGQTISAFWVVWA